MDRYDITIQMLGVEASGPQYVWGKVPAEEGELVLYTDAQATIATLQARVKELEQWVQDQSTANLETMRHTDEMQSRAMEAEQQLTQRTAELEAAKRERDVWYARYNELSGVKDRQLNDLQAELERVRGELVEATHNANVYQSLYSTGCMDRALLENDLRELRTLILALPKVEGEIVAQAGYVKDRNKVYACFGSNADMTAYAAIVQHRQGMEG